MQVDDRLVNLSPGMAVTVEIKTATRRIISYLCHRWRSTRTTACENADAAKDAGRTQFGAFAVSVHNNPI
jgi:hypothetical protein